MIRHRRLPDRTLAIIFSEGSVSMDSTPVREVIDRRPRRRLLAEVSQEIAGLGVKASDEQFLRSVATEIASVLPVKPQIPVISIFIASSCEHRQQL